jgi:hypothetical protein
VVKGSFINLLNLGFQEKQTRVCNLDWTSKSMLYFEGASRVLAFFDFLYNNMLEVFNTMATDVPLLLAPVPFLNASLHQLDVKASLPLEQEL